MLDTAVQFFAGDLLVTDACLRYLADALAKTVRPPYCRQSLRPLVPPQPRCDLTYCLLIRKPQP
jgi:hypothetical protein